MRDILTFVIALSLGVAVFLGYQRSIYEAQDKNVEIAVNLSDIKSFAAQSGRAIPQELALFKAPGTTTVLYKEETLGDLKKYVSIYSGEDFILNETVLLDAKTLEHLQSRNDINYDYNYIFVQDQAVYKRLTDNLRAKNPEVYLNTYEIQIAEKPAWLIVSALSGGALSNLGFGFDGRIVAYLESINMQVLPQVRTWDNARSEGMNVTFADLKGHANVRTILFNDKALPGFPDLGRLTELASIIKQNNWNVGLIEFMPQKGFEEVAYANSKKVVRFFSIDSKEGDKTTPEGAIDKYTLAASERNDRLLFVRPITFNDVNQEQGYISHINDLKQRLVAASLYVAPVKDDIKSPFQKIPMEFFVLIMSLGVIAGGLLLADKLDLLKLGVLVGLVVLLADIFLIFHTRGNTLDMLALGEKAMALLAACIFPTYGLLVTISEKERNVWQSFGAVLKATAISMMGALFVIGLLADMAYMVKIDQFIGVKLAHLVPVAIILWYLYSRENDGKTMSQRTVDILKRPLTAAYALLSLGILAALYIYMARSGNDAAGLVSGWELKFRSILDQLLYVRPRTKEFLIGYPILLTLYYLGYKLRYLPFVALAVIGQVSVVDTYAHIHTPIMISLLRTVNGLWLGVLLALVCIFAYLYYFKNWGSDYK